MDGAMTDSCEHDRELTRRLDEYMQGIESLFSVPVAVTVLVRIPGHPTCGLLVTPDPIKTVMAELYRISDRPPTYKPGDTI